MRADILSSEQAARIHDLLTQYTALRIQFYTLRDVSQLKQNAEHTAEPQTALWASVVAPATAQPTPPVALIMSGMNDVLNTQGYTQAAFLKSRSDGGLAADDICGDGLQFSDWVC